MNVQSRLKNHATVVALAEKGENTGTTLLDVEAQLEKEVQIEESEEAEAEREMEEIPIVMKGGVVAVKESGEVTEKIEVEAQTKIETVKTNLTEIDTTDSRPFRPILYFIHLKVASF